jgi:hypothetical protein
VSFPWYLSADLTRKLEHFPSESNLENPAISMQILKITFFIKICRTLPSFRGEIDHRISWASGNSLNYMFLPTSPIPIVLANLNCVLDNIYIVLANAPLSSLIALQIKVLPWQSLSAFPCQFIVSFPISYNPCQFQHVLTNLNPFIANFNVVVINSNVSLSNLK